MATHNRCTDPDCERCQRNRARVAQWYRDNPDRAKEKSKQWRERLKDEVITAYGRVCTCCGETEFVFLAIDHIDGGGAIHRRALGGWSYAVYLDLKRRGFPEGYQVLCHNCNIAKHILGECPHRAVQPVTAVI